MSEPKLTEADRIGDYYDRVRARVAKAQKVLETALADPSTPPSEINRLRELRDDAGDTGD